VYLFLGFGSVFGLWRSLGLTGFLVIGSFGLFFKVFLSEFVSLVVCLHRFILCWLTLFFEGGRVGNLFWAFWPAFI